MTGDILKTSKASKISAKIDSRIIRFFVWLEYHFHLGYLPLWRKNKVYSQNSIKELKDKLGSSLK